VTFSVPTIGAAVTCSRHCPPPPPIADYLKCYGINKDRQAKGSDTAEFGRRFR